ncbi:hypothetical protein TNCV_4439421 [Trichonephila clavipes]|nr:hypothetical protein TNCV_4439421 [Trichonephila clavipes]
MLQDYDTSFSRLYFSQPRFSSPPLSPPVPTFFSSVLARSLSFISSLVRPVASRETTFGPLVTTEPFPLETSQLQACQVPTDLDLKGSLA